MAFLDDEGNRVSTIPPVGAVGPAPTPVPDASRPSPVTNSVSNIGSSSTSPATTGKPLSDTISDLLKNDPNLMQQQEWLKEQYNTDLSRANTGMEWLKQQQALDDKSYQLALSKLNAPINDGSGAQLAAIAAAEAADAKLAALRREQAAHDLPLSQEASREALFSRGMGSSGQTALQAGEITYAYQNVLKELDIAAEQNAAQRAAQRAGIAAQQAANAQSRQNSLASLEISRSQDAFNQLMKTQQAQWAIDDLSRKYKIENGQLVMQTGEKLMAALWDEKTGRYIGPGDQQWDALGNPIAATPTGSSLDVFAPVNPIGTSNASPYGW